MGDSKQIFYTHDEFFDGHQMDHGLGFCLQCVAEYKISGEAQAKFPRYACTSAPIAGVPAIGPTCYQHLNVQPPQPPPLRPKEEQVVQRLLMPNGQPPNARHAR
jgi:hypothetical protein